MNLHLVHGRFLLFLVTKKDGSTRFCVDYRKLNDVTVKDAYPLPLISDCLETLSGAKYFGTMDVNSGFWQVGLDPMDKEKTTSSTSLGLYQFVSMPLNAKYFKEPPMGRMPVIHG